MIDEITYKNVDGIKCCIINKKDYKEKQAMIAFRYGSSNNEFFIDEKELKFPPGIAHFLEHKLFEEKDYNVFDEFNKLGATANAFTNFTTTAYYFNCTENFAKSFKLLLNFVSSPYFTDENVEKEKGIITQEIKMYEDDPYWRGYFNLMAGIFGQKSPLANDIAGSVDDINQINKDMLYSCYEQFYTKDNAIIICCGDFQDEEEIYNSILKNLKLNERKKGIFKENKNNYNIVQNYVDKKMNIEQIIYNIGFKDEVNNVKIDNNIISSKIMLDIVFGKSSNFYQKMYDKGIIDNSFSFTYNFFDNTAFYAFAGNSNSPKEILEHLKIEIESYKKSGIEQNHLTRIKNKHIGSFIMQFNSINSIVSFEADLFCKGSNLLEYYEAYENIMLEDVDLKLKNFDLKAYSLSTIS